jgi:uncharacterized protein YjbI with pentapeptide repeats
MNRSRFQIRIIAALCGILAFTGLRFADAANPDHVARFRNTHQCDGCDLSEAALGGIQAPNAKLSNANLRQANLYGAKLRGADLTGAILDGANLEMADLTDAIGAVLGTARTDKRTTCPDGTAGPCR